MRILYVEDNLMNLRLVQRLARAGNHHIINHADGETALANFESDKPDLVLMDIQLKGVLNGLDVVRTLRARGIKTPIIAVTAYAMLGDRERCLEAGCDAYLAKPLPVEQLVALFERYDPANREAKPEAASPTMGASLKPEASPNGAAESVGQPPASSDVPAIPEAETSDTKVPTPGLKPEAAAPEATTQAAKTDTSDTPAQTAIEAKTDSSSETTEPATKSSSDEIVPGDNTNKS